MFAGGNEPGREGAFERLPNKGHRYTDCKSPSNYGSFDFSTKHRQHIIRATGVFNERMEWTSVLEVRTACAKSTKGWSAEKLFRLKSRGRHSWWCVAGLLGPIQTHDWR